MNEVEMLRYFYSETKLSYQAIANMLDTHVNRVIEYIVHGVKPRKDMRDKIRYLCQSLTDDGLFIYRKHLPLK